VCSGQLSGVSKREKNLEQRDTEDTEKNLEYYLSLPYSILLIPSEDGTWLAKVPELPGCVTFGDTKYDALEMIEDAKLTWISGSLEEGYPIPEPVNHDLPASGNELNYEAGIEDFKKYPPEQILRILAFEMRRYTTSIHGYSELMLKVLKNEIAWHEITPLSEATEKDFLIRACEHIVEASRGLNEFNQFMQQLD
jgi:predicted RNase H-like HicB family nuclease